MIDQRRLLRRVRLAAYGVVLALGAFGLWRYDVVALPSEGCSPIAGFAPGDRLLVDLHPGRPSLGDAVLYRSPLGELLLGRVADLPAPAPPETRSAVTDGALWIVSDLSDCPGDDSRTLGPIGVEAVAGRVVLALPW